MDERTAPTSDDVRPVRNEGPDLPPPKTVREDLLCPGCGYNLRGLRFGARCPECARPIVSPDKDRGTAQGDQLLQIAPDRRVAFGRGCALAAVCLIVAALTNPASIVFHPDNRAIFDVMNLALSIGWFIAVLLLTPGWLGERGPTTATLRQLIRIGTLALPILPLMSMVERTATLNVGAEVMVEWTGSLAAIAAMAAAAVLGWILSDMAEDAEIEFPSRALMMFVWLMPVSSMLLSIMPADVTWVDLPVVGLVYLLWCFALIAGAYGLLALRSYIRWTIRYAMQRADREMRRSSSESERSFPEPVDKPRATTSGGEDDDDRPDDDEDAIPLA
jgi:hypothetical protein